VTFEENNSEIFINIIYYLLILFFLLAGIGEAPLNFPLVGAPSMVEASPVPHSQVASSQWPLEQMPYILV
jgi:hypothetical protein